MAPRRLEDTLTKAALGVLIAQLLLLGALRSRPEAPANLPPIETALRGTPLVEESASANEQRADIELLDRLLAQRVADAAERAGVDPGRYGPEAALREAALANPDPQGEAVLALVDGYAGALAALGETLDATSSRAGGANRGAQGSAPPPLRTPPPAPVAPTTPAGTP